MSSSDLLARRSELIALDVRDVSRASRVIGACIAPSGNMVKLTTVFWY